MRKTYNAKKKFIMSVLALVLSVAMLIGTTFAWFTDSVTSGKNMITAGNLDIEAYHSNKTATHEKIDINTSIFDDVALWEPGAVEYENITIENVGNLAAKIRMQVVDVDKNSTTVGNHDLTEVIKVAVKDDGFTGEFTRDTLLADTTLEWSTFQGFYRDFVLAGKTTNSAPSKTYGIALYWAPTENDNAWNLNNGATSTDNKPLWISFGLNVVATQNTVETDSFDTLYDENATLPVLGKIVNEKKTGRGSFVPSGEGSSVPQQVKTSDVINVGSAGETGSVQIPAGTLLYTKNDQGEDVPITTTEQSLSGEIQRNAYTTSSSDNSFEIDISFNFVVGSTSTPITKLSNVLPFTINLSSGLKNVKLTHSHNGGTKVPMTAVISTTDSNYGKDGYYYYDEETGVLSGWSSTFSKFEASFEHNYVTVLNNQGYNTLDAAAAAAQNGDVIQLIRDITSKDTITFTGDKEVSLDLYGKTLTFNSGDAVKDGIVVENGATLNLTNSISNQGKFLFISNSARNDGIYVTNDAAGKTAILNIENPVEVVMEGKFNTAIHAYASAGNAEVNIEDGTKINITTTSQVCALFLDQNSLGNMNGGEFTVIGDFASYGNNNDVVGVTLWGENGRQDNIHFFMNGGKLTVGGKNAFAQGIQIGYSNGYSNEVSGTVNNGKLIINPTERGEGYAFTAYNQSAGRFAMNGGSVSGDIDALTTTAYGEKADLTITGGLFSIDPAGYLVSGCGSEYDEELKMYKITISEAARSFRFFRTVAQQPLRSLRLSVQ